MKRYAFQVDFINHETIIIDAKDFITANEELHQKIKEQRLCDKYEVKDFERLK